MGCQSIPIFRSTSHLASEVSVGAYQKISQPVKYTVETLQEANRKLKKGPSRWSEDSCSAHCNCKAGLDKVFTHIATLLFGIDAGVHVREKTTVTQVQAYWMEPTRKQVASAPVPDVNFTSAAKRKRKLDTATDGTASAKQPQPPCNMICLQHHAQQQNCLSTMISLNSCTVFL